MFVKEGKDFIYVCSQKMIDRNSESEAFSNEYLKVSVLYTEDRKTAYYYRITPLKKLNIKVFQKMIQGFTFRTYGPERTYLDLA